MGPWFTFTHLTDCPKTRLPANDPTKRAGFNLAEDYCYSWEQIKGHGTLNSKWFYSDLIHSKATLVTHFEGRTANSSTLHRWAAVPRLELSCIWEGSSSASGTDEVYHSYGVCRRGLHILKIGGQGFRRKPVVASVSLGPPTQTQNKRWICLWGTEHSIVSSLGVRLHISIPSTCWLWNKHRWNVG